MCSCWEARRREQRSPVRHDTLSTKRALRDVRHEPLRIVKP